MISQCIACEQPTEPIVQGGRVILAECHNLACPLNLSKEPGRTLLLRCINCGQTLTRRDSSLSERRLECLPCGIDFDVPECYMPNAATPLFARR